MRNTFTKVTALLLSGALILNGNDAISFAKGGQSLSSSAPVAQENTEESADEPSGADNRSEEAEEVEGQTGSGENGSLEEIKPDADESGSTSSEPESSNQESTPSEPDSSEPGSTPEEPGTDDEDNIQISEPEFFDEDESNLNEYENKYYCKSDSVLMRFHFDAADAVEGKTVCVEVNGEGITVEKEEGAYKGSFSLSENSGDESKNKYDIKVIVHETNKDDEEENGESGNAGSDADAGENGGSGNAGSDADAGDDKNPDDKGNTAGKVVWEAKVTIIQDQDKPELHREVAAGNNEDIFKVGDSIIYSVTDSLSGVNKVWMEIEIGKENRKFVMQKDENGKYKFTFEESFKEIANKNGVLTGLIYAKDHAGNVAEDIVTIKFDFTAPDVKKSVCRTEETEPFDPELETVEGTEKAVYYTNKGYTIKIEAADADNSDNNNAGDSGNNNAGDSGNNNAGDSGNNNADDTGNNNAGDTGNNGGNDTGNNGAGDSGSNGGNDTGSNDGNGSDDADIEGKRYVSGMASLKIEEKGVPDGGLHDQWVSEEDQDGKCSVEIQYVPKEGVDFERKSYVVTAVDKAGNTTVEELDVVYDCKKPELKANVFCIGSDNKEHEGKQYDEKYYVREGSRVEFVFADEGSDIKKIIVKDDENPDGLHKGGNEVEGSYSCVITSTAGEYLYSCDVTDKAGNSEQINVKVVVVSTKHPKMEVSYNINKNDTTLPKDGGPVYGNTIRVSVKVEDNLPFIEKNVSDVGIHGNLDNKGWHKMEGGYEAEYIFSDEGTYDLQIGYTDLIWNSVEGETQTIIIDKTQPVFRAYVCDDQGTETKELSADTYFDASKKICLEIKEEHFTEDGVQVKVSSDLNKQLFPGKINWEKDSDANTYTAYIDCGKDEIQDGKYNFEVECTDKAGNSLEKTYKSGIFYIDKTVPFVDIEYADGVSESGGYFNVPRTAVINVVDENFNRNTAVISWADGSTEKIDINNWKVDLNEHKYTYEVEFNEDGEYAFDFFCADWAGNQSERSGDPFTIDRIPPVITVDLNMGQAVNGNYYSGKGTAVIKIKETNFRQDLVNIDSPGGAVQIDPIEKWNTEGDIHTATVNLTKDGVYNFKVTCEDKAGNHEEQAFESGEFVIDTTKPEVTIRYSDSENKEYYTGARTLEIIVEDKNFDADNAKFIMRGESANVICGEWKLVESKQAYICKVSLDQDGLYDFAFVCTDMAGNSSDEKDCGRFIIDQTKPKIDVIFGSEAAKNGKYYRERSAVIEITEKNFISGNVVVAAVNGTAQLPAIENWSSDGDKHRATVKFTEDGVYQFTVKCEDAAGNPEEKEYISDEFIIDTTEPEVKIEYDKESPVNGKYHNTYRTARVIVTDANFDGTCVTKFDITSDGDKPQIGKWTQAKSDDQYICEVFFDKDGEYRFRFSCEDLAGNKSKTEDGGNFIIDTTKPEISVTYDNNNVKNGKYYGDSRTATISITDKSFADNLVSIEPLSASGVSGLPAVSSWTSDGDRHTAKISFMDDGSYGFRVTCVDLADNAAKDYLGEIFIIDRSAPEIVFGGVRKNSANNGVVAPTLKCTDAFLDEAGSQIILTGTNHGQLAGIAQKSVIKDGIQLVYPDFEHIQEMDDFYTLKVTAVDLAGNETEDELNFSVNRFGSTYRISTDTQRLVDDYYTGKAPVVTVTEINIDELEYGEVTISKDGQTVTLAQGSNYVVTKEGADEDWKSYTYSIKPGNFAKDGVYSVGFYSKDKASNTSDNRIKGKEIEFALDTTAPSIVADGIESGERYKEKTRDVTVDVKDNMFLTNLLVTDGSTAVLDMSEKELAENGGVVTFTLDEADEQRDIIITARDKVGNVQKLEFHDVVITTKEDVIKDIEKNSTMTTDDINETVTPNDFKGIVLPSYEEDDSLLYMVTEVMSAAVLVTAVVAFYRKRRKRNI